VIEGLVGLVGGLLAMYPRVGECGRESALETLRDTVENGGGKWSSKDENLTFRFVSSSSSSTLIIADLSSPRNSGFPALL